MTTDLPSLRVPLMWAFCMAFGVGSAWRDDRRFDVPGTPFQVISVEEREVYSRAHVRALGLAAWPDGCMGVLSSGEGRWEFFSPSGVLRKVVCGLGPLSDPLARLDRVPIRGSSDYHYLAGGPVVQLGQDLLLMAHAERYLQGRKLFHSSLVLTRERASGGGFEELGPVIEAHVPPESTAVSVELGSGPMVLHGGYLYVFHRDMLEGAVDVPFAVSRVSAAEARAAIDHGKAPTFRKWFEGGWTEPGLRGRSSPLECDGRQIRWMDVKFFEGIGRFVCVAATTRRPGPRPVVDLRLMVSENGVEWSESVWLTSGEEELFYPTLVELGPAHSGVGSRFVVYHTASVGGDFRRTNDARLMLRTLEIRGRP